MSKKRQEQGDGMVVTETKRTPTAQRPRLFRVLLHNDDFTTMEFVVEVLVTIFRKSETEATRLMLKVHHDGSAVAGLYPHEIAETKAAQVMQAAAKEEFPLMCTVEPADEGEAAD